MLAFWESVADLRRIELVVLLIGMFTPVICGTVLLTVRHRIKVILEQSNRSQLFSTSETVEKLEAHIKRLESNLTSSRQENVVLHRVTAPRQLTEDAGNRLVETLRGIKAAPVIVSAYAFEEEKLHALTIGCNDYISKPIKRSMLISLIEKYI